MRNVLFILMIGALLSPWATGQNAPRKTVWIDESASLNQILRQEIASHPETLVIVDSQEDADITLREKHQGGKYAAILLREKHGRRDTVKIVATDRKTRKILASRPISPQTRTNTENITSLIQELVRSR